MKHSSHEAGGQLSGGESSQARRKESGLQRVKWSALSKAAERQSKERTEKVLWVW